jgi:1-phosphofructokinase
MEFEQCLVKATAVATARCEVDRPCNLKVERVAELEASMADAVEKLE